MGERLLLQLLVLVGTVVVLSGVMNNVGALALLLPVAMRLARELALVSRARASCPTTPVTTGTHAPRTSATR